MELIFLDIDFTILRPKWKLAIVDKDEPSKILLRLDPSQASLLSTYWKKYELRVTYNGNTFWLSPELLEAIQKIKKNITLDRIGISTREWTSSEILDRHSLNIDFILNNLKFLKGRDAQIILLTAREGRENHVEFISAIKQQIAEKLKLRVVKEYFVSDMLSNNTSDYVAAKKANIILEHMIGYKIKRGQFSNLTQLQSNNVLFFDDDVENIEMSNRIQELFEETVKDTQEELKKTIIEKVKNTEIILTTHLATNNDLNPFIKNDIRLVSPYHIELFESFKKRKGSL